MSEFVSQTELPIAMEAGGGADNFGRAAPPGSDLARMHARAFPTGFCDQNKEAIKNGEFGQTCTLLQSKVQISNGNSYGQPLKKHFYSPSSLLTSLRQESVGFTLPGKAG